MITADDYAVQAAAAQEALASARRHAAAVAELAPVKKIEKLSFQATEDGKLLVSTPSSFVILERVEIAELRKWLEETFP